MPGRPGSASVVQSVAEDRYGISLQGQGQEDGVKGGYMPFSAGTVAKELGQLE